MKYFRFSPISKSHIYGDEYYEIEYDEDEYDLEDMFNREDEEDD